MSLQLKGHYVDITKFEASQHFVHETLKCLGRIQDDEGHSDNLKGVVIAVFGTSSGTTVILL